jgi:hypothetical protein
MMINLDNFCTHGNWAVVDSFSRSIWITVQNETLCDIISNTMMSKCNSLSIDISKAKNWESNLIDSTVSLYWSLEKDLKYTHQGLIKPSMTIDKLKLQNNHSANNLLLLNETFDQPLNFEQRQELQNQILSFSYVIKHLWAETFSYGKEISYENIDFYQQVVDVYAIELTRLEIEKKLVDICYSNMNDYPKLSLNLLLLLGKFFD